MPDNNIRKKRQELRIRMNQAIGKYAHLTHIVPKGPRQKVRDWLIRETSLKHVRRPKAYRSGKKPDGINEYGFFREETGLGQGTRMYARSIEEAGIPHSFIHLNFLDWLPQNDDSFDNRLVKRPQYAVNLIHLNPDQWDEAMQFFPRRDFDRHYNIGVWLWELETLPKPWLRFLDYVDELWVPSEFIARAAKKETGKPVVVIPYGIDIAQPQMTREDLELPKNRFIVLAMFDSNSYIHRKNPMAAINAFIEAFSGNPDAMLVLKANHPKEHEIAKLEQQLKAAEVQYRLILDRMPRERLNALIASSDVFISLHRSEGFGLPIAEAMGMGTAVVATNWSSNTEFMDETCACCVGYKLVPVGNRYQHAEEGQMWAEPDIHEAAEYLKKLYEDPQYRDKIALAGQEHVRTCLSVEGSGKKMKKRLEEILRS